MSKNNIIERALTGLVNTFEVLNIPYVIVGGIAVIVFGRIRTTTDIDIILNHEDLDKEKFVEVLNNNGFDASLNEMISFDEGLHATIFFKETMFRIDLKGIYQEKDRVAIKEAKTEKFGDLILKIDAPENIVLNKLYFGSEIDIEDAMAVLAKNYDDLDFDRLADRCKNLGVHDEYEKLLSDYDKLTK
ncbi:MAG: hypothetical protein ACXAD7_08360 [Candidatus Kariarchaeaceae archaeon]|jgi:hypothetical protein